MTDDSHDDKKLAKARAKAEKKAAKAQVKIASATAPDATAATLRSLRLPTGVAVDVRDGEGGSELVVSGLTPAQLRTVAPQVARDVLIAVTAEKSTVRAALMRFVREGIFQSIVKVVAGLVVAWVLLRFGLAK